MNRHFLMISLTLAGAAAAFAEPVFEPDAVPPNAGIQSFTVTSDYQNGPNKLEVLTPDTLQPGRTYPVLYVLPVNTGTSGQWGSGIVELQKRNVHNRYQVIIVAPAFDMDPWFGDLPEAPANGKPWIRQQAYVTDVVVPFIEKTFPATPSGNARYLLSFSKGGFGALGLLLRNPGTFAKATVFDCADPVPPEKIFKDWGMEAVFGTLENFDRNFNLVRLLATEPVIKSMQSGRRITLLAGEAHYTGVNLIEQRLRGSKIPYTYILMPGTAHAWGTGWLDLAVASILPIP